MLFLYFFLMFTEKLLSEPKTELPHRGMHFNFFFLLYSVYHVFCWSLIFASLGIWINIPVEFNLFNGKEPRTFNVTHTMKRVEYLCSGLLSKVKQTWAEYKNPQIGINMLPLFFTFFLTLLKALQLCIATVAMWHVLKVKHKKYFKIICHFSDESAWHAVAESIVSHKSLL